MKEILDWGNQYELQVLLIKTMFDSIVPCI